MFEFKLIKTRLNSSFKFQVKLELEIFLSLSFNLKLEIDSTQSFELKTRYYLVGR